MSIDNGVGEVFSLLLVIFLGQNIMVEMFLYHDQLANGKVLSWAPLSPSGQLVQPCLMGVPRSKYYASEPTAMVNSDPFDLLGID